MIEQGLRINKNPPNSGNFWTSKTTEFFLDDDNDGCNANYNDNYGNFDDNYDKND